VGILKRHGLRVIVDGGIRCGGGTLSCYGKTDPEFSQEFQTYERGR
jgi:hypothetical protein